MLRKFGKLHVGWRLGIKLALFGAIVLAVLYPHPIFLARQIANWRNLEGLIQPDLPAMPEINREIDQALAVGADRQKEFKAVERYVYQRIKYQYDWNNWGNVDYWPTAAEVWDRQREDCDGRAVLAVSILRSRGFPDARLVGNLNHIWVAVDKQELMGPQEDKNFKREGGKTRIALPSRDTMIDSLAMIARFPVARTMIIYFAALILCFYPGKGWGKFFGLSTIGLIGMHLCLEWGNLHLEEHTKSVGMGLIVGGLMIVASLVVASLAGRKPRPAEAPVAAALEPA